MPTRRSRDSWILPAERQSTSMPTACLLLNATTVGWLASRCGLREHRCSPKLLVAVATFGSPDDSMLIRRSAAMSGPGVPDGRCS